jgi:hypothetical protein
MKTSSFIVALTLGLFVTATPGPIVSGRQISEARRGGGTRGRGRQPGVRIKWIRNFATCCSQNYFHQATSSSATARATATQIAAQNSTAPTSGNNNAAAGGDPQTSLSAYDL